MWNCPSKFLPEKFVHNLDIRSRSVFFKHYPCFAGNLGAGKGTEKSKKIEIGGKIAMNERPGLAVGFLHTKLDLSTSENNLSLCFKNATAFCLKNQASGGGGLFTKLAIFKSFYLNKF